MRVLVAGATGVVGRALLPLLRAHGHQVTALVRTAAEVPHADQVVVADALDRDAVVSAVASARPEVVVHQLSALRATPGARWPELAARTARLRVEGTANLLRAAEDVGARRFVAQSIAFATAPGRESGAAPGRESGAVPASGLGRESGTAPGAALVSAPVLDESAPLHLDAPDPDWAATVRAVADLERQVAESTVDGLVLRYGTLHGPGTLYHPLGAWGLAAKAGRLPLVGGGGLTSFLTAADAARAAALAVTSDATGVVNVVDDDPAPAREWVPRLAERVGGPPPRTVPADLAVRALGWFAVHQQTALPGASNHRAAELLGWRPTTPTWRSTLGALD